MNYFTITSLFIVISNSIMSIFMFAKGRNDFKNILWGLICVCAICWGIGGFIFSVFNTEAMALLGFRIGYIGVAITPAIFMHFVLRCLDLRKNKILIFWYTFGIIFLIFSTFTNQIFWGKFRYVYNQFYWHDWFSTKSLLYLTFYIINSWILVPYSLYLLIKGYKQKEGKQAEQIKYLLIGTSIGWIGYELMWLTDFRIDFYPYYNIFLGVFPILIAYFVYKHNVLDIKIVLQKGLVYSVLVAIITGIYSLLVLGVGSLFQGVTGYQSFWLNTFVVFIIALLFNPIRDWIQHVLDRRFFNGTLESLEQESQRLQQELFHKEKLAYVGQLASSVAHEIRNPLTTIETFVDCLPKKYAEQGFKEKFNRLVPQEIGRIKKIVNHLLGLAKQRPLVLKSVDIIQSINGTLDLLESHFQLKRITVNKEFENNEIIINGDEDALRQVFLNLFLNAIQAMPEAGTLDIRVSCLVSRRKSSGSSLGARSSINNKPRETSPEKRIADVSSPEPRAASHSNNYLQIIIADTGCGIPAYQLKNLFTPFQTTKEEGIGLGLSITKEIVEQHGGLIGVKSEIDKGTTFVLEFPALS